MVKLFKTKTYHQLSQVLSHRGTLLSARQVGHFRSAVYKRHDQGLIAG